MLRSQIRCVHRGVKDLLNGSGSAPEFTCAVHGTCTIQQCAGCSDGVAAPVTDAQMEKERLAAMAHATKIVHRARSAVHKRSALAKENGWGWYSLERMMRDVRCELLPKLAGERISAVAGVPRSGMPPASALATLLHVPLMTATPQGLRDVGSGSRTKLFKPCPDGRVVVLEDSVYSGQSLARLRNILGPDHLYAALYSRPAARYQPDVFGVELESPHFFAWHVFNSGHMSGRVSHPGLHCGAVLDMDGIICEDPPVPDEPADQYEAWLTNACAQYLPRTLPCRAILTARYERYRDVTTAWLTRHDVKYGELIMAEDRSDVAAWKTWHLKRIAPSIYFESSERQAQRIHELWGKGVVICPPAERVWIPQFIQDAIDKDVQT